MANTTDIFGFRIYTGVTVPTDTSIGLYAVSGANSELRYSEAPLTGTSEAWATGFLTPDGIGEISEAVDTRRGGGVVQLRPVRVVLRNTDRLRKQLEILGVNLSGAKCDITEFIGTLADSDATERRVIFSGTCEDVQWSETTLALNVVPSLDRVRRTNLSGMRNGEHVPVTFGSSDPANGRYFKFKKIVSVEDLLSQPDIGTGGGEIRPGNMNLFPVVGTFAVMLNNEEIRGGAYVRIGYMDSVSLTDDMIAQLAGKFALCKEGPADAVGKYRKIYSAKRYQSGNEVQLEVQFSDYWPVDLAGNYDGTAENQTWFQFFDIAQEFDGDTEQCDGFYDSSGAQLVNAAEIYSKNSEDEIIRLPAYGSDIDASNTLNNTLVIDPKHFNNGIENLNGYIILPVENFGLYTDPDLSAWNTAGETWWGNFTKKIDGIYHIGLDSVDSSSFTNPENVIDKNHTTYSQFNLTVTQSSGIGEYYKVFKFDLPKVSNFNFTNAYLGVNLWSKTLLFQDGATYLQQIMSRGYINRRKNIVSEKALNENANDGASIDCIPDFYYASGKDTANKNFYKSALPDGNNEYDLISGYFNFDLEVNGPDSYNSIEECAIALPRIIQFGNTQPDDTHIYQLCVIFENSASLREIYV